MSFDSIKWLEIAFQRNAMTVDFTKFNRFIEFSKLLLYVGLY